jgi:hypothetical protein
MKVIKEQLLTEAPREGTVPFKLPNSMLNNPNSIDLKGMAAQTKRDADAKAAEEARAREFAANKEKYKDLISRAQAEEDSEKVLDILFEELVPSKGKADTVAGELVRAMMRILYRDYNDGDLFYEGYGIETCGGSVAYLISMIESLHNKFGYISERQLEDDAYTAALNQICNEVCEHIFTDDSVWQTNEDDSRSDKWDRVYAADYQSGWEPEYDYDFQIPPTIQKYIDAGHIIEQEFIDQIEMAIEGHWGIKYDSIEDGWSGYINITGLNRESYDELESWGMWEDSSWSDYIDELVDEYGNLGDDDDIEEDLASDIRKGRLNKAYQDEHGANFDAEDENHYIQFQDHEMHTHEVSTAKDRWGNTHMTGFKNRHPRVSSQSWGRAWDKRTGEVTQFSGPKYKVRADMAKYLDSKNTVTEGIEDTEQVIIGFDGKGGRKYYNNDTQEWKDTAKEATVFKGVDSARNVWFKLDKKPFKRVFVVNNDENI